MPIVSPQASRQLSESQYALINPQKLRIEDTGLVGIGLTAPYKPDWVRIIIFVQIFWRHSALVTLRLIRVSLTA